MGILEKLLKQAVKQTVKKPKRKPERKSPKLKMSPEGLRIEDNSDDKFNVSERERQRYEAKSSAYYDKALEVDKRGQNAFPLLRKSAEMKLLAIKE